MENLYNTIKDNPGAALIIALLILIIVVLVVKIISTCNVNSDAKY